MRKTLLTILSALLFIVQTNSQVTVKKDLVAYYDQLPAMPATLQDAYDKCNCKTGRCNADTLVAALKRSLQSDAEAMNTLTDANAKSMQNGKALATQMDKDNVKGMNDNQKLDYAKNNSSLNGGNPNAIAFAQKMQNDPAEKAKLQAMSPSEKIAYLQQNGMLGGATGMPATTQPAAPSPLDNPKIDSAVSKRDQMQAKLGSADRSRLTVTIEHLVDISSIDSAHNVLNQQQDAEMKALPHYSGNEAGVDPVKAKAINSKYLKKNIDLASAQLQKMTKAYTDLLGFLKTTESPFNSALMDAGYGYTATGGQDDNLGKFSSGQVFIMSDVNAMMGYARSIYDFASGWQNKWVQAQK